MLIHFIEQVEPRSCAVCGCTDNDCSDCVAVTGEPCSWATKEGEGMLLCSRCAVECARLVLALDELTGPKEDRPVEIRQLEADRWRVSIGEHHGEDETLVEAAENLKRYVTSLQRSERT